MDEIDNYITIKRALDEADDYWERTKEPKWSLQLGSSLSGFLCLLQGITSCNGSIFLDKTNSGVRIWVDKEDLGDVFGLDVPKLVTFATPAPFGKGEETIYDTSIRNGLQISADRLIVENMDCLIPTDIQDMAPRRHIFIPKLYKMHIYKQGGHFQEHVDTIHSVNHLATLIVSIPTEFCGGELVVKHGQDEKTYNLAQKYSSNKVKWVAFYTDCKHSVKPVLSGTRVVLQFDLIAIPVPDAGIESLKDDPSIGDWEQAALESVDPDMDCRRVMPEYIMSGWSSSRKTAGNSEALDAIVGTLDLAFRDNARSAFAILLEHSYSLDSLKPHLLKGVDEVLWQRLHNNFSLDLLPVIVKDTDYETEGYCYIYPFSRSYIHKYLSDHSSNKRTKKDETTYDDVVVVPGSRSTNFKEVYYQQYIDYTGNECQPLVTKYFTCCMLIKNK